MARADESSAGRKSLARSMGEAVGHVLSAIRKDPTQVRRVSHRVEVEQRGSVILRRTTIEEIETKAPMSEPRPPATPANPDAPGTPSSRRPSAPDDTVDAPAH